MFVSSPFVNMSWNGYPKICYPQRTLELYSHKLNSLLDNLVNDKSNRTFLKIKEIKLLNCHSLLYACMPMCGFVSHTYGITAYLVLVVLIILFVMNKTRQFYVNSNIGS